MKNKKNLKPKPNTSKKDMCIDMLTDFDKYKKFKEEFNIISYALVIVDDCINEIESIYDGFDDKGMHKIIRRLCSDCNIMLDKLMKNRNLFRNNDNYGELAVDALRFKKTITKLLCYCEHDFRANISELINKEISGDNAKRIDEEIEKEMNERYWWAKEEKEKKENIIDASKILKEHNRNIRVE